MCKGPKTRRSLGLWRIEIHRDPPKWPEGSYGVKAGFSWKRRKPGSSS